MHQHSQPGARRSSGCPSRTSSLFSSSVWCGVVCGVLCIATRRDDQTLTAYLLVGAARPGVPCAALVLPFLRRAPPDTVSGSAVRERGETMEGL